MPNPVTRRRCPGCGRTLGQARAWCAACDIRLPADMRRRIENARNTLTDAETTAIAWLARHPSATQADLDVLTHVARGTPTAKIAAELGVSPHTVTDRLRQIYRRWGCVDRASAVATAYRLGYLKPGSGEEPAPLETADLWEA